MQQSFQSGIQRSARSGVSSLSNNPYHLNMLSLKQYTHKHTQTRNFSSTRPFNDDDSPTHPERRGSRRGRHGHAGTSTPVSPEAARSIKPMPVDDPSELSPSPSSPLPPSSPPQTETTTTTTEPQPLPHLTAQSTAHMVSVSRKPVTRRTATVIGSVLFSNSSVLPSIRAHLNRKGDVLGTARVAGIMGAKRCADIVPLCHPGLGIEHVAVDVVAVDPDSGYEGGGTGGGKERIDRPMGRHGGVRIEATVVCEGKTGVEMEAFTAVMAAAVTVVDMCKAVDKGLVVQGVRMVRKEGGRSGTFVADGYGDAGDGHAGDGADRG